MTKNYFHYDAVVMLTSSIWGHDFGNRFHFAREFAKDKLVLFVQDTGINGEIQVNNCEVPNLKIIHLPIDNPDYPQLLQNLLREWQIKQPIFWAYLTNYSTKILNHFSNHLKIYHGTELYLMNAGLGNFTDDAIKYSTRLLNQYAKLCHASVACVPKIADDFREICGFNGKSLSQINGVDAQFYGDLIKNKANIPNPYQQNSQNIIYHGGINDRLNCDLIKFLIKSNPAINFHFIGPIIFTQNNNQILWQEISKYPNFIHHANLSRHEIAHFLIFADAGFMPYCDVPFTREMSPIKAFEFIACGLPVLTTPIKIYDGITDCFYIAQNPAEFQTQLTKIMTQNKQDFWSHRWQVAQQYSWHNIVNQAKDFITQVGNELMAKPKRANIGVLITYGCWHHQAARQFLEAFESLNHKIYFIHCVHHDDMVQADLNIYDALIVFYAVRMTHYDYITPHYHRQLLQFNGPKILFIQDEYDVIQQTRANIWQYGFDYIYNATPNHQIAEYFYGNDIFPHIKIHVGLTGYMPPQEIEQFAKPLKSRTLDIFYRGRELFYFYGNIAREKFTIADDFKIAIAKKYPDLKYDIANTEEHRIYNDDYYQFLSNARAMLATESGGSISDFDGTLIVKYHLLRYLYPKLTHDKWNEILGYFHELPENMQNKGISPKFFEAIRLRVAIIAFRGDYSGILQADKHYIVLERDMSNIADVIKKIQDDDYITQLTQRAYQDIVLSDKYSFAFLMRQLNDDINQSLFTAPKFTIYNTAVAAKNNLNNEINITKFKQAITQPEINENIIFSPINNTIIYPNEILMVNIFSAQSLLNYYLKKKYIPNTNANWVYKNIIQPTPKPVKKAIKKFIRLIIDR